MNPMGGMGQQVGADLMDLGKSVVKGVGEAAVSFVKPDEGKQLEQGKSDDKNQQVQLKKQAANKQYQEVKNRLAEYVQQKNQQDAQIKQKRQQEEQQKVQKKEVERQEKESFLQKLMKNLARGSHGETDRQKE